MLWNSQFTFSLIIVSINRCCAIIYGRKPFFKTKKWVAISILGQWIIGCILCIPTITTVGPYCTRQPWVNIYALFIVVVFPALVSLVVNMRIFIYVRSSSSQVQPQGQTTGTQTSGGNLHNQQLSRRDTHLLRHIVFMFCIYFG
ncbi:unnamed protein product, partial [Rotaria sp. Silwood2]